MILVLLGTQDKSFVRLLEAIEEQIIKKHIREKVIVQAGYTVFSSKNMEIKDFLAHEEILKLMDQASFVISHAGVGTIMECLKKEKKMIVAARRKCYQEHTNDHQLQLLDRFAQEGYIIPLYEMNELESALKKVKKFKPKKFNAGNEKMISLIETFIESSR